MPVPNDLPPQSRWWPTTMYPNSVPVSSYMLYRTRTGQRWKFGDDREQVLFCSSEVGFGSVIRNPQVPKSVPPRSCSGSPEMTDWWNGGSVTQTPLWCRSAVNKAYARFRDKALGESSSLGASVAEGRDSLDMVGGRSAQALTSRSYRTIGNKAIQLRRAYKNLRRGDLVGMLRTLGVNNPSRKVKRKHRSKAAQSKIRSSATVASATWLEYYFGWAPLIGDMYSAVEVLTQPLPGDHVRSSATCERSRSWTDSSGTSGRSRFTSKLRATYRTGARVQIDNLNLFMANQLGLANPVAIAWELVPFSFVVDWFTAFGNVLESLTDWVGVRIINPFRTAFAREDWTQEYGDVTQMSNGTASMISCRSYRLARRKGLLQPLVTPPRLLNVASSHARAATAVSLLTVLFLSK